MPLLVVLDVLRLSHKYQVDTLFKRALLHLSEAVPTSLDSYRKRRGTKRLISPKASIEVVKVAREVSADWVLPFALYFLCGYMAANDFKRYEDVMPKFGETDKHICVRALRSLDVHTGRWWISFGSHPLFRGVRDATNAWRAGLHCVVKQMGGGSRVNCLSKPGQRGVGRASTVVRIVSAPRGRHIPQPNWQFGTNCPPYSPSRIGPHWRK
jgi:hypothetical protein